MKTKKPTVEFKKDIYKLAIEHYEKEHPGVKGINAAATFFRFKNGNSFYMILEGEREMPDDYQFFVFCNYPQGFDLLKSLYFPNIEKRLT